MPSTSSLRQLRRMRQVNALFYARCCCRCGRCTADGDAVRCSGAMATTDECNRESEPGPTPSEEADKLTGCGTRADRIEGSPRPRDGRRAVPVSVDAVCRDPSRGRWMTICFARNDGGMLQQRYARRNSLAIIYTTRCSRPSVSARMRTR